MVGTYGNTCDVSGGRCMHWTCPCVTGHTATQGKSTHKGLPIFDNNPLQISGLILSIRLSRLWPLIYEQGCS